MFTSNPWAVYARILAGGLLIYYIFVGWKYFRADIKHLLGSRAKKRQSNSNAPIRKVKETSGPGPQHEEVLEEAQQVWQDEEMSFKVDKLLEHLTEEIQEAHQKNYDKQDLIQMLQIILKEYSVLKGTAFQSEVTNLIDTECAKYGSIHLSKGDKREVWNVV
ncbi:hypothetical protein [Dyadobacter sp. CY261]|uniref:hypothetical protein n=1 Tax=Dyadobacter sp. CY261 TaxID=2907203 RepID=UPI001F1B76BF|nr:hypothetical protein [Dyadobacter sp. CY261]